MRYTFPEWKAMISGEIVARSFIVFAEVDKGRSSEVTLGEHRFLNLLLGRNCAGTAEIV